MGRGGEEGWRVSGWARLERPVGGKDPRGLRRGKGQWYPEWDRTRHGGRSRGPNGREPRPQARRRLEPKGWTLSRRATLKSGLERPDQMVSRRPCCRTIPRAGGLAT